MRALLVLLLALFTTVQICSEANAQARASSYAFASAERITVDQKTSPLGAIFQSINLLLDEVRGTRGMMIFIGAAGAAMLFLIAGMPFVGMGAGAIAALILLVNKPLLFAVLLIPAYLLKKNLSSRRELEERVVKDTQRRKLRKENTDRREARAQAAA